MRPLDVTEVVRGQYDGYRDIPGVAPDSDTETFIALRCDIDNWRWAGVPFFLRTGKELGERRADHLDRVPRAPEVDVPGGLRRRRPGARPPDLRPGRLLEAVALLLREAAGTGHEAREAQPAVRPPRDRRGRRRARGLRAPDPRRHGAATTRCSTPPRGSSGSGSCRPRSSRTRLPSSPTPRGDGDHRRSTT